MPHVSSIVKRPDSSVSIGVRCFGFKTPASAKSAITDDTDDDATVGQVLRMTASMEGCIVAHQIGFL